MKFKSILLLLFCCQVGFAQLSDLTLSVMNQLNIEEEDCDGLFAEMELPNGKNETVVVIPKIGEQDEDYTALDSYVALVNNKTNEIKSLFFESHETNGWQSDAIFIYEISIDTTSYMVDNNSRAFGVILHSRNMSQPNPYYDKSISLFIQHGDSLQNVLKNFEIYSYGGETDMKCYGDFYESEKSLTPSKNKTNGFYDIEVTNTIKEIQFRKNEGECNKSIASTKVVKSVLEFVNGKYILK
ncbi:hypothetical protein UMM65_11695 [Aureibaculum sp. 2210JD6-5]|uniref:hypothetical protein n=1 Tax=Aureibaculum sp. 2210JD6-5 TaxID=3103957 RepID=UPI002AAD8030|nr:hypothetical protein [Aureibaculum sp. 2210JD6-5]MDY7395910.1 hypothetical protein [Aureibaculum sp. 2210JD6-5]